MGRRCFCSPIWSRSSSGSDSNEYMKDTLIEPRLIRPFEFERTRVQYEFDKKAITTWPDQIKTFEEQKFLPDTELVAITCEVCYE